MLDMYGSTTPEPRDIWVVAELAEEKLRHFHLSLWAERG